MVLYFVASLVSNVCGKFPLNPPPVCNEHRKDIPQQGDTEKILCYFGWAIDSRVNDFQTPVHAKASSQIIRSATVIACYKLPAANHSHTHKRGGTQTSVCEHILICYKNSLLKRKHAFLRVRLCFLWLGYVSL